MYIGLQVKYPLFLSSFNETCFFPRQIFEKHSNIKFHKNQCSGSRVVPRGQKDGRTDMTKLIIAFRSFENAPKDALKMAGLSDHTVRNYIQPRVKQFVACQGSSETQSRRIGGISNLENIRGNLLAYLT